MMWLYRLEKNVLRFCNNASEFINGLSANEITKPRNAFVNMHGKIIAVFDQIIIDEEEHWIVLEPGYMDNVLQHLERYIKLSGVKVEVISKNVYFDLMGSFSSDSGDFCIPQNKGQLVVTSSELKSDVSDDAFTLFRVQNNIALQGTDYENDFLLNVSTSDLISFTKGCFLGQEPISKVYNRSKPTWKLVVRNEDECTPEEVKKMTSRVKNSESGKTQGFVFVKNSG